MSALNYLLLCLLFLTLGTYAVPKLRLGTDLSAVPFAAVFAALLTVSTALQTLVHGRIRRVSTWLVLFSCGYLFSLLASTLFADVRDWSLTAKYAAMGLFPLLAGVTASRGRTAEVLSVCLAITSLGVFAYGMYGFTNWSIGDSWEHNLGYFGVTYKEATRNGDMLYLLTAWWLMLGLGFLGMRSNRRWLVVAVTPIILSLTVAIAMSLVRGAWISMACTFLTLQVLSRKPSRSGYGWAWTLAPVLVLCAGFALFTVLAGEQTARLAARLGSVFSLSADQGNSNPARMALIAEVLGIIGANPVLGIGPGNLRYHLANFYLGPLNHAENTYLQVLVEHGLVGFISLLGLLGWITASLIRIRRTSTADGGSWATWALCGLVVNFSFYGLFNNLVDNMWFWTVIGLAAAITRRSSVRKGRRLQDTTTAPVPITSQNAGSLPT